MKRTTHAREYADVSALALLVLSIATFVIALTGSLRPVFIGRLNTGWAVLAALAFFVPAVGMGLRRTWGWYAALVVLAGFVAGGLVQIVVQDRIGLATVLVGGALAYCVIRSSSQYPEANYPIVPSSSDLDRRDVIGG